MSGGASRRWDALRPVAARGGAPSRVIGAALLLAAVGAMVLVGVGASLLRSPATAGPGGLPDELQARVSCAGAAGAGPVVPTTSAQLVACPDRFEGRQVSLVGEVVGEVFGRGERRWVQLNDDPYAFVGPLEAHHQTLGTNSGIHVLLPADVRPAVLGGPGVWGDRVEVWGTFRRAAVESQGGPAVIADRVRPIAAGQPIRAPLHPPLVVATLLLVLLTSGIWAEIWLSRRR